jgi:ribosomal protein L5
MLKNQTRLFFFKEKIFYWKILNILRVKNILNITKILVSFNIRDLKDVEDSIIAKFFFYIEVFTNQKIFLSKFTKGNPKMKMKNINLTGQVTLRGIKAYNFFDFFSFFFLPILKKNFIKTNIKIDNVGNLSVSIRDLSFIPGLAEDISKPMVYPLKIDVILKSSNFIKSNYFFKEIGLL